MQIEEYNALIEKAIREFPLDSELEIQRGAKRMRKEIRDNTPVGKGKKGEHKHKLKNSWRVEMAGSRVGGVEADIYNTAPHFHLVERGHVQKNAHGQVTGYKQGKFFMKNTVESKGKEIQKEMSENLIKKLGDKLG